MKNNIISLFATLFILICVFGFSIAEASKRSRDRLEQLFVWKVSDSLNLNDDEESKLNEALTSVNRKKQDASRRIQSLVTKMSDKRVGSDKAEDLLNDYRDALKEYNSCQETELEKVEAVIGSKRMGQYIVIKHKFSDKLKSVLSQNSSANSQTKPKNLKAPSIIEE